MMNSPIIARQVTFSSPESYSMIKSRYLFLAGCHLQTFSRILRYSLKKEQLHYTAQRMETTTEKWGEYSGFLFLDDDGMPLVTEQMTSVYHLNL